MRSSGEVITEEVIKNPEGFKANPENQSVSGFSTERVQISVGAVGGEERTDRMMIYRQSLSDIKHIH